MNYRKILKYSIFTSTIPISYYLYGLLKNKENTNQYTTNELKKYNNPNIGIIIIS